MKAVYMAILILTSAMAIGQYANADEVTNTKAQAVLDQYYDQFCLQPANEKHTVKRGITQVEFGDNIVGYYNTKEEYYNAYDPAINGVE